MATANRSPVPALGAANISKIIAGSLNESADPQLKTTQDAVAIACHAGMLAVGFSLKTIGDDIPIGNDIPAL